MEGNLLAFKPEKLRIISLFSMVAVSTLVLFQNCGKMTSNSFNQSSSSLASVPISPSNTPANATPINNADGSVNIISAISGVMSYSNKASEQILVEFDKIYLATELTLQCKSNSIIISCNTSIFQDDVLKNRTQVILDIKNMSEGKNDFEIGVSSTKGGAGKYRLNWTFDKSAPIISLNPQFDLAKSITYATFKISAEDVNQISEVLCLLDDNAFSPCSSSIALPELSGGTHNFQIKAVDIAGNVAVSQKISWMATVTATNTQIKLVGKPSTITDSPNAAFQFTTTSNIIKTSCQLDNSTPISCTNSFAVNGLLGGAHIFKIFGFDGAGKEISSQSYNWTINIINSIRLLSGAGLSVFNYDIGSQKATYRLEAPANLSGTSYSWLVGSNIYNSVNPYLNLTLSDLFNGNASTTVCVEASSNKVCGNLILNIFKQTIPLSTMTGKTTTFNAELSKLVALGRNFVADGAFIYADNARFSINPLDKVKAITGQYLVINESKLIFYNGTGFEEVQNLAGTSFRAILLNKIVPEASFCSMITDGANLFYGSKTITAVSASEAQVVLYDNENLCSPILKDSKSVVICNGCSTTKYVSSVNSSNFVLIPNADPDTFSTLNTTFFKDKSRVYYSNFNFKISEVSGADPQTISLTNPPSNYIYDVNRAYHLDKAIVDSVGTDVKVSAGTVLLSNGFVFFYDQKIPGFAASEFTLLNGGKASGFMLFTASKDTLFVFPTWFGIKTWFTIPNFKVDSFKLTPGLGTSFDAIISDSQRVWYLNTHPSHLLLTLELGPGSDKDVTVMSSSNFFYKNSYYSNWVNGATLLFSVDDFSTFQILNNNWARTSDSIYSLSAGGKILVDIKSFQLIGTDYLKDTNSVFAAGSLNPIVGADSSTFKSVTDGTTPTYYGKDKSYVYYSNEKVVGADPETFTRIFGSVYFKDKSSIYVYRQNLQGVDMASFVVTSFVKGQDKNNCYFLYTNKGPVPTSGVCP